MSQKGGIMSWRIIYIENSDSMQLYLDNLLVKRGEDKAIIPLNDIFSIIIDNYNVTITGKLINRLAEYKISVVFCNEQHLPCNYLLGLNSYFKVSQIVQKQLNWTEKNKKIIWKKIIQQKIHNQKELLKYCQLDLVSINYLDKFEHDVLNNDETNREGLAAKVYFKALFGNNFTRDKDSYYGYNSALNYGYSILRSCVARQLVANGLNPVISIWHSNQFNQLGLADDIMEIFRPVIDMWVALNFCDEMILDRNSKFDIINCMNKKLIVKGEKRTLISIIGMYINSIIQAMETGNEKDILYLENTIYI